MFVEPARRDGVREDGEDSDTDVGAVNSIDVPGRRRSLGTVGAQARLGCSVGCRDTGSLRHDRVSQGRTAALMKRGNRPTGARRPLTTPRGATRWALGA